MILTLMIRLVVGNFTKDKCLSCFIAETVVSNAVRDGGGTVSGNDTYQMSDDILFAIDSVIDKLVVVTTLNNDYPAQTEITDKTVTVTYYLTAPEMIVYGKGSVNYDNTKFRRVSMELSKITDMLLKNRSVSANTARFCFSKLDAFDFTKKGGKVTATKRGTATIYAYAQNGVMAKIKIKVK